MDNLVVSLKDAETYLDKDTQKTKIELAPTDYAFLDILNKLRDAIEELTRAIKKHG